MDIDVLRAHAAQLIAELRETRTAEAARAAAEASRAVVLNSPPEDLRTQDIWWLGWALVTWWDVEGTPDLFDEAIRIYRVVADLPSSRESAVKAIVLAWSMRAERDPSRATLDAAIAAVGEYAGEFPEAADQEADLLVQRYTVAHGPSDLNEAITRLDARSRRSGDQRTRLLLAVLLRTRYDSFRREDDLVRAIDLAARAMLTAHDQNDEERRLEAGRVFADGVADLPGTPGAVAATVRALADVLHENGDQLFHQELVAVLVTSRYRATGRPALLRVLFGLYAEAGYDDANGLFAREIVLEWAAHRKARYAPIELDDHEVVVLLGLCAHAIKTHTAFGDLVDFLSAQLTVIANVWSSSVADLSPDALKSAIDIIEPVVDVVSAAGRKPLLSTLSSLHLKHLNRAAEPGDGRAFIEVNRRLAAEDPSGGLGGLANALVSSYRRTGADADLDEALRIFQELGDQDLMTALVHANALMWRFDRGRDREDWLTALRLLDRPDEDLPDNRGVRAGFAELVLRLHEIVRADASPLPAEVGRPLHALLTRTVVAVDDVRTFEELRHRIDALHAELPELSQGRAEGDVHAKWTFAASLIGTHAVSAPVQDLDRAVRLLGELLSENTGTQFRATVLSDLSGAHVSRFARTGDRDDLDRSITAMREAARLRPDEPFMLVNLAHKLTERFDVMGGRADLDESVALCEHAERLMGEETAVWTRFRVHNGLSGAYRKRFAFTADPADLDRALTAMRAALAALPDDHPDRAMAQHNLAGSLLYRAAQGLSADPEEIVELMSAALDATPAGHPASHGRRVSLAQGLLHRAETPAARPDDVAEALRIMRDQLAEYGPAEPRRFEAAYLLASALSVHGGSATEAVELYRDVVRAPQAAAETRLRAGVSWARIEESAGSAADALAAWDEVVRLLGVVAWQGLPRSDQERFLATYQHYAARAATFAIGAGDLERALDLLEHGRSILWQRAEQPRVPLDLEPGESVVVLVADDELGHALVVGRDGVQAVELPGMVTPEVERWCDALEAATDALGVNDREVYEQAQQAAATVLDRLWHSVVAPVLATLPEGRRRLFWCPAGRLAMLPLHAATDAATGRSCLDVAVSSYVPSTGSLATALARRGGGQEVEEFLTIAVDDHPDEKLALVHVKSEVATVERLLPGARHKALLNLQATRAAAAEELARHRFVHVSCHGAHDPNSPSASGLVLADGVLSVLDIAEVRTDDAQFAYLSACRTAMGAPELSDESIHLGAALFLAGFRQVVGTLWAVGDQLAAKVAEAFYRKVAASGTDAAATAIGEVALLVRAQRKEEPLLWAGYVHIGA